MTAADKIDRRLKALLLVAHGSRRALSNAETGALTSHIRELESPFDLVEHAFLEMAEPTIGQVGEKLIAAGAGEIVVMPCFMATGRHVAEDIPEEVAQLQARHPNLPIHLAPHLGAATGLADLILGHLQDNRK